MDEEKKYLINIEDNLDVYAERAAEAKKRLEELKKANDDLHKSGSATAAELEKSNGALRAAQQEYNNATKNVVNATKANKAAKDSYDELYQRWKLAEVQLKLMGDGFETDEKGVRKLSQKFIEQSKVVDDAKKSLDAFGKATHNNTLNVGNYTESVEAALSKTSMMPGPVGNAANSIKGLGTTMKAVMAIPLVAVISLIVAAITGLIKIFKSSDSGATEVAARWEQLKAVADVLRQRVLTLIGAFTSLFKGDFKAAGEALRDTFTGIKEQIQDATTAAYKYTYALDTILDAENNYISRSADMRNAVARLEYTAQDRSRSTKERRAALVEAMDIRKEEVETEKGFLSERLNAEAAYLAEKAGLQGEDVINFIKMSDEEQAVADESLRTLRNNNEAKFKEMEQLYASYMDAETEYFKRNKENISKLSGFDKEIENERKTVADKAKADLKERLQQEITLRLLQAGEDTEKIKEALRYQYEELAKDTELNETQRQILKVQYEEAIAKIDKDYKQKQLDADKKFSDEVKSWKEADDQARSEYEQLKYEGDLELLNQILDREFTALKASNDWKEMSYNQQLLAEEQYNQAKKQLSQARIDQMWDEKQAVSEALSAISENIGAETAAGKIFAIAAASINTWVAASQALADPTIPSTIARVAAMVAIIGTGLMTVRNIMKVKVKGSSSSGSTSGSTSTSISSGAAQTRITAQAAGTTVLNKNTTPVTANESTAVNQFTPEDFANAASNLPRPIVTVEDINAKVKETDKVSVRATV